MPRKVGVKIQRPHRSRAGSHRRRCAVALGPKVAQVGHCEQPLALRGHRLAFWNGLETRRSLPWGGLCAGLWLGTGSGNSQRQKRWPGYLAMVLTMH